MSKSGARQPLVEDALSGYKEKGEVVIDIKFFVEGEVKGKPAAGAALVGKHARVISKLPAGIWFDALRSEAQANAPTSPITGPVRLGINCVFRRPQSGPGHKRRSWMQSRPDADNIIKLVGDVLTGCGYWGDDAQVASVVARKVYSNGEPIGAWIWVLELDGPPTSGSTLGGWY